MSDMEKNAETSELQKNVQTPIIKRRNFLKYSIIGGLILGPTCVMIYKKYQINACTHQLIYPGPFEKGKTTPEVQKLGGTQWDNVYDVTRWEGIDNSFYVPRSLCVSYEGGHYNVYAAFEYTATNTATFCSEFKIDVFCGNKLFVSNRGFWTAISLEEKEPQTQSTELKKISNDWKKIWNLESNTKIVTAKLTFEADAEFVSNISRIVLSYKNI